jgi:hypothetical protein
MTKALADERLQRFVSALDAAFPAYVAGHATRLRSKGPGSFLSRLAWLTGMDLLAPCGVSQSQTWVGAGRGRCR